jgi:hypothetical protein
MTHRVWLPNTAWCNAVSPSRVRAPMSACMSVRFPPTSTGQSPTHPPGSG